MTKPLHTRPFCIEHARAGAPFCCANGEDVEVLKWDRKHDFCIVGLANNDLAMRAWRPDGSYANINSKDFKLVMTPLGMIDGKPVFVGDEIVSEKDGRTHVAYPEQRNFVGARWPAPAPVYPKTLMTNEDLNAVYDRSHNRLQKIFFPEGELAAVANAALRHAIESKQVMVPGAEMKESDILEALDEEQRKMRLAFSDKARTVFVNAVKSLLVTEPEIERLKADLALESRDLGKAEHLLEALGYRSAGNGEWSLDAARCQHFYGTVDGFHVKGDKASIDIVQGLAERGLARDMAIAEAVKQVFIAGNASNYYGMNFDRFCQTLNLNAIVAGFKS